MEIEIWFKLKLLIDDEDYEMLKPYKLYFIISENKVVASMLGIKHKTVARMITSAPKGMVVHHKNCNPLDNRKENLMVLTPKEHAQIHGEMKHEANTRRKQRELEKYNRLLS